MKANHTELVFIIDRSGSMQGKESDVNGGFKSFINEQRMQAGTANLTVVQFDTQYEIVMYNLSIQDESIAFELEPRGGTALLDAIGMTIDEVGNRLKSTPENERPERVLFIIMTDGEENSSRMYSFTKVQAMIKHQKDVYAWEFLFMGADIDAFSIGASMGVGYGQTISGDKGKMQAMFATASSVAKNYRATGMSVAGCGQSMQEFYDAQDDDKTKQGEST